MRHMSEVRILFAERTRVTAIANEARIPVKTVWSWKKKGVIPPWRRGPVLDAVRRLGLEVPNDVLAYLARAE